MLFQDSSLVAWLSQRFIGLVPCREDEAERDVAVHGRRVYIKLSFPLSVDGIATTLEGLGYENGSLFVKVE